MNFLLAPNAMKGALSAQKIATILSKTLRRKYPDSKIISTAIADGGNGTLDCLMNSLGGTIYEKEVTGPIVSIKTKARYGITSNNIAIIESAEAIGLHLLSPSPDSIAQSTSRGVGELIQESLKHKPKEIWIGLGGTATNDGGAGLIGALGVNLLDEHREIIRDGTIPLLHIKEIMNYELGMMNEIKTIVLSDVKNILLGEHGATYTFAKQKGASDDQLPYLEAALKNYSEVVEQTIVKEFRSVPGSGAAGGLAFGLIAFCNAEVVSGIDFILDTIVFDEKIKSCDCIITTEGMLDEQTLYGKGIAGIAQRAQKFHKPVHAFVGKVKGNAEDLTGKLGLASLIQISPGELTTQQAMRDASWLLADAVFHHDFHHGNTEAQS